MQFPAESSLHLPSRSVYQQPPSLQPTPASFSQSDRYPPSAHQPKTSTKMRKPGWNRGSGGYRSPEAQNSGIAIIVDNKNPPWHRKHYQDQRECDIVSRLHCFVTSPFAVSHLLLDACDVAHRTEGFCDI